LFNGSIFPQLLPVRLDTTGMVLCHGWTGLGMASGF